MFVRRVNTRPKGTNRGISYRLVHSVRCGPGKTRQVVLGYFPADLEQRVPKPHWRCLAAAIKDLLAGQTAWPLDPDLSPAERQLADRIAAEAASIAPLVRRRMLDAAYDCGFQITDDPQPAGAGEAAIHVLPSSLRHTDVREAGAARLLYLQAQVLDLRACLTACGLRPKHVRLGLAQILARALHPASERETLRWLRRDSALGDLLGLEPADLSSNSLYTAADALWRAHRPIERELFTRERELFGLEGRIVFYDLTNTYHTGRPAHQYAARGRSKQKRHDAPLVTLGLLLDGEGFPRRSEVLKGNVGEAGTLQQAIQRLDLPAGEHPTVVFDGGIVSAANLRWLRAQGLHWITVERQRAAPPEREPDTLCRSASGQELKVWRLRAEAGTAERAEAGTAECPPAEEARLCVWSPARDRDEQAMLERQRERNEAELRSLHEGLSTPRRLKKHTLVLQKVGRLKEKYKLVAGQYTVEVEEGKKGKAQAVTWVPNPRYQRRERQRGTSLLRTSRVDWDDRRIVREYCRLSDIEATFRSLKEELGLRPLYHRLARRVAGHLFLSVLAYHVVHALRCRLKREGIRYSWGAIRERMRTWVRLTSAMRTVDGKVWSQRQDVNPNNDQARIAAAAGLSFRRNRRLLPLDPAVIEKPGRAKRPASEGPKA